MAKKTEITATDIKKRLQLKHHDDFFLCEVNCGSKWFDKNLGIIDAWAMKKSWRHPLITAYEIKVNRQDFLRDYKWQKYLDFCHELYFAAPPDIIFESELPDGIGLIQFTAGGGMKLRRKAKYRDIQINPDIFIYILMNRVDSDRIPFHSSKKDYFKEWLENKIDNRTLARNVKNKTIETIRTLENKNNDNELIVNSYRKIEKLLKENGLEPHVLWIDQTIRKLINDRPKASIDINKIKSGINNAIHTLNCSLLEIKEQ